MTQTFAVEVTDLRKIYGSTKALDGISLSVRPGQVHAFLGPNGAGKTTLVRILSTLLSSTSGQARVFEFDVARQPAEVRKRISVTGQFASVDEGLTGRENLVLMGRLHGYNWQQARARAGNLLEAFSLTDAADRLSSTYSGGMRRRLDIAASIVVPPELLFLDEPTTGLDPRSRAQVWEIVRALVASGATIVLTTQYLEEADQLSDQITVVDRGHIVAEGSPAELKSSIGSDVLKVNLTDPSLVDRASNVLRAHTDLDPSSDGRPGGLTARVADVQEGLAGVALLRDNGIQVSDVTVGQATLDEVFLALTGQGTEHRDRGADDRKTRS